MRRRAWFVVGGVLVALAVAWPAAGLTSRLGTGEYSWADPAA